MARGLPYITLPPEINLADPTLSDFFKTASYNLEKGDGPTVVLNNGKPFFKNTKDKLSLNLLKTRTFSCGNVILYYQPIVK